MFRIDAPILINLYPSVLCAALKGQTCTSDSSSERKVLCSLIMTQMTHGCDRLSPPPYYGVSCHVSVSRLSIQTDARLQWWSATSLTLFLISGCIISTHKHAWIQLELFDLPELRRISSPKSGRWIKPSQGVVSCLPLLSSSSFPFFLEITKPIVLP